MPPQTTSMPFTSLSDVVESALDYLGGTSDEQALRDCLRSAIQAYREVTNARTWTYLYTHGRVETDPSFLTGTISYIHSGGFYPRQVLLTGSTWPTNVGPGWQLRVGYVTHQVESRIDESIITLTQDVNPGMNLAAGTPFTLYHDEYLLPTDYISQDTTIFEGNFGGLRFSDPTDGLWWQRFVYSAGVPRFYTIMGSRSFPGRMILKIWPYPDQQKSLDFVYKRRPRDLVNYALTTGSVSVTAGSKVVTGNGVIFPQSLIGAIFRTGTSTAVPSSWLGLNPPTWETVVYDWTDASTLVMYDASPFSGQFKYLISDPIDVEQESMMTAVLRGTEKYLQIARNVQGKPDALIAFEMALKQAQAADSRSFQGRSMGEQKPRWVHPKYQPAVFFPTS